ncbi:hypothetical protein crov208 [Cafeteria roenbergensis virus]|uniref:Uncharacterized protein n=1 Tax=Cafeteria roenbergensis virus (strain BV-PW1) TaxID=693272 RepID=E3T4X8_CROVB|nr:hypothetical protein crov208 [Cafeteria roenbergensis virus BV-PW1]ADO67241.1 hypothetical protein crov208 [Cafeteria roenbergensis virus BV-PW1]
MDKYKQTLTSISIKEHASLDNIKELIENIIANPNRLIVSELLKIMDLLKKNIDNLDISHQQKIYYKNIIDNSELFTSMPAISPAYQHTPSESTCSVDSETSFTSNLLSDKKMVVRSFSSNKQFQQNILSGFQTGNLCAHTPQPACFPQNHNVSGTSTQPINKLINANLINKIYPEYKTLDTNKYNANFTKLNDKLYFY